MFATVYPLVRLPRRFTFFDYKIPKGLSLNIGDVVRIPFKGTPRLGIVRSIEATSAFRRIMPIERVVLSSFLAPQDVERFEIIAWNIVQSPSTVLHAAFRDVTGRQLTLPETTEAIAGLSISADDAKAARAHLRSIANDTFHSIQCTNETAFALIYGLRKQSKKQILILVPRDGLLRDLYQKLPLGEKRYVLHGHTSPREREAMIRGWQSGMIRTLIGSRQVALLPAHDLGHVVLLEAGSDDWSHLERNPRIDPRRAAALLATSYQADLIHLSPQPPVEDLKTPDAVSFSEPIACEVVRLGAEEEKSGIPFVCATTLSAINEALQSGKSVLLLFNRKGVANRLQCRVCDHIPTCGSCGAVPSVRANDLVCRACGVEMWIPKTCPACHSDRLSQKGIGNEKLKELLSQHIPEFTVGIVDERIQETQANVQIVTEYYFKNIVQTLGAKTFGLIAELSFDQSLLGTDFRTAEYAGYKLQRLLTLAKQQQARCIIETWVPDVVHSMLQTQSFLSNEHDMRKKYRLPPFTGLATVSDKEHQTEETIPLDQDAFQHLHELQDSCIISIDIHAYESPRRPQKPE